MTYKSWLHGIYAVWNVILFVGEISIGLKTHSLCPIVHGLHVLYICVEHVIYLVSQKISATGSEKNTFGWARSQVLGVAINSVFLGAFTFSMVISALKRFAVAEHLHDPMLLAIIGAVAVNADVVVFIAICLVRCIEKKRKKSSQPQPCEECEDLVNLQHASKQPKSEAVCSKKNTLTNMLGGAVMIIAGVVRIYYHKHHWTIHADTVASLLIVVIIISGTFTKLKNACMVLLQAAPGSVRILELQEKLLKQIPSITNVHEFHIWQLTDDYVVATVHLCFIEFTDFARLSADVRTFFAKHDIHKVTIQPEFINHTSEHFQTLKRNNSSPCAIECGPDCDTNKCCTFPDANGNHKKNANKPNSHHRHSHAGHSHEDGNSHEESNHRHSL